MSIVFIESPYFPLKNLRKTAEITQEELAEFLGLPSQIASKRERGENCPEITLPPAIAQYFGVTVDGLLSGDGKEKQFKDIG